MDWQLFIMFMCAAMVPISSVLVGVIVDRRSKKQFAVTAEQSKEQIQATAAVTAKEAANHEFQVITTGFSELTDGMKNTIERLQVQNEKLERLVNDMDSRFAELNRRHRAAVDHIDYLETLVPVGLLPRRPKAMGEN